MLEEVRRLSQVVHSLIEKMRSGERLSDETLDAYLEQLRTVDSSREGLEQQLARLSRRGDRGEP